METLILFIRDFLERRRQKYAPKVVAEFGFQRPLGPNYKALVYKDGSRLKVETKVDEKSLPQILSIFRCNDLVEVKGRLLALGSDRVWLQVPEFVSHENLPFWLETKNGIALHRQIFPETVKH